MQDPAIDGVVRALADRYEQYRAMDKSYNNYPVTRELSTGIPPEFATGAGLSAEKYPSGVNELDPNRLQYILDLFGGKIK
jgi:hypothetical protein